MGSEQSEYFLSGTASAYTSATALTSNGRWAVHPASSALYTTRMVVYRPINPKRFDGAVVVEWLNVSGGVDAAAAWLLGNSLFGPVISSVPDDATALAFYDALRTFADFPGFSELKRTNRADIDLPLLQQA